MVSYLIIHLLIEKVSCYCSTANFPKIVGGNCCDSQNSKTNIKHLDVGYSFIIAGGHSNNLGLSSLSPNLFPWLGSFALNDNKMNWAVRIQGISNDAEVTGVSIDAAD